ncbi:MAG TPA: ethanolamine ammonia-lyase subunit EutC [Candidatus Acidoferrales bacterium]|nr:ethanolamine ammonia-lyase subunit EutC [Candidatus Acidoferrales bacterium]
MASDNSDLTLAAGDLPEIVRKIRARTPARILAGRAGAAYRTSTQMELREAHAAARDAVREEFDIESTLGAAFVQRWEIFEAGTRATSKDQYLLRPDLGRHFEDAAPAEIESRCSRDNDLQIAIGDGLSVPAVAAQVPPLLPLLLEGAKSRGWTIGRTFAIRYCRVGILNEIGELLKPRVAVLLIGERPGLATAESLSAYMAYRPRAGHSDANRNLISNIHARGLRAQDAATRILNFAALMMKAGTSGFALREDSPALGDC